MVGEHERAVSPLETARTLSRTLRSKAILSVTLAGLVEIAIARGQLEEAAAGYGEGLLMGRRIPGGDGLQPAGIGAGGMPCRRPPAGSAAGLARFGEALGLLPRRVAIAYEADVACLPEQLDAEALAAAQTQGRTMSFEDIVGEATAAAR